MNLKTHGQKVSKTISGLSCYNYNSVSPVMGMHNLYTYDTHPRVMRIAHYPAQIRYRLHWLLSSCWMLELDIYYIIVILL